MFTRFYKLLLILFILSAGIVTFGQKDKVNLSKAQEIWLRKHPEISFTGDPNWLPQEAFTSNGNYTGMVADYLRLIEKRLGIKIKIKPNKTWSEALAMAKRGQVDMISAMDNTARRKYLFFTDAYLDLPVVITVRKSMDAKNIPPDLHGLKIVIPRGYAFTADMRKKYPQADFIYVNTVKEGLIMLASSDADAIISTMSTTRYLISNLELVNLKIIRSAGASMLLAFGIRRDWPEFIAIMDKALESISEEERLAIHNKWVPDIKESRRKREANLAAFKMLGVIILSLLLLIVVIWLLMRLLDKYTQSKLRSGRSRLLGILFIMIFIAFVVTGTLFSLRDMENRIRIKAGDSLKVISKSTHQLLKSWISHEMHDLEQWSKNTELINDVERLLKVPRNQKSLLASKALADLRDNYKYKGQLPGVKGFFVIAPDRISLGSSRDGNVGTKNLIAEQRPEALTEAFAGKTVFVPPIYSDVPLKNNIGNLHEAAPTMFIAAPIKNKKNKVIAVLTLRIDPSRDFSRLCVFGRIGKSGESYAFDARGLMMSESRFKDDLERIGLIKRGDSSTLAVKICDPGVNLMTGGKAALPRSKQPLVKMVKAAISGQNAVNIDGYRDYRGVRVLGSWLWDSKLGIGIASKINEEDALQTYYIDRIIIASILGVTVFMTLLLVGYTFWSGERSKRSIRNARDEWERVAEERTAELQEAEERSRLLLESAGEGIFGTTLEGVLTFVNPAATRMLGYETDEMLGNKVHSLIHHTHKDGRAYPIEQCPMWAAYTQGEHANIDNEVLWRKDGSYFDVHYNSVPIYKDGELAGSVITFSDITQRKKAEQELMKLSLATEASPASIVISDAEGNIEYVNPKFTEVSGYSYDEAIGKNPRVLNANVQPLEFYKKLWDTIKAGKEWQGDFCNKKKNGEVYWEHASISPILNAEKKITHFVAVKEDITERRKLEEDVKRINFLSDLALELTGCAYWHIDYSDPDYYYQSKRAAEMLGESLKENGRYHLQDEWFSRLLEADKEVAECTAKRYQGAIDGKHDNYDSTYAYKRPVDGKIIWIHAVGKLIHDKDGKLEYMYGAYQDITRIKEMMKEIEENAKMTRGILDGTQQLIGLLNPDGTLIDVNNAAMSMVEENLEQLIGKPFWECPWWTHDKSLQKDLKKGIKKAAEGKIFHFMGTHPSVDGKIHHMDITISPIKNDKGEVIYLIPSGHDVSELKETEKALEKAMSAAKDANKAKGDFLANMSHEIRTPMNAIIGMNHLLQKTKLDEKQINYVTKVDRAAHNLLGIINDILDFSKIEAGKLDIENIDFDLDDVLEHLSTLTSSKAQEKGLELIFNVALDVPYKLIGDPLRIGQVLLNFVSNAIKFTEKGEIIIFVKLNKITDDSADILFSVKDTGIGLKKGQQEKLFKSFTQADTSTTRKFGGTGLGLAISKKLVNMMDGEVGLESKFGQGSNFYFNALFGIHEKTQKQYNLLAEDLAGTRVLIVDDNESAREVLQGYVEDFNFEVTTVSSGEEALSEMENASNTGTRPYDLILMDWKMSGMNGIETAKIIKNNPKIARTPQIIMVTNYGREYIMKQAEGVGLDAFLIKPIGQSLLFDTIMNVFGKSVVSDAGLNINQHIDDGQFSGLSDKHILLVEDNDVNQEVAVGLLEEAGILIDVVNNGKEAIEILKEKNEDFYSAVLMDLQMPVMDGYKATRHIRKKLNFTNLIIIAMSADAMLGVKERCLKVGMNDYLTKPIDPGLLFSILRKWLNVKEDELEHPNLSSSAINEDLLKIEGFDTLNAIARVGGSQRIYTNILRKFCKNSVNSAVEIKDAIDKEDIELAERIAHTVKGVAGNIGANALYKSASELNDILKQGLPKDTATILDDFSRQLASAIKNINNSGALLEEKTKKDIKTDSKAAAKLLGQLAELLEDNDSDAQECLEKLMAVADYAELKEIAQMVSDYEFDEALDLLRKFAEKHKLPRGNSHG